MSSYLSSKDFFGSPKPLDPRMAPPLEKQYLDDARAFAALVTEEVAFRRDPRNWSESSVHPERRRPGPLGRRIRRKDSDSGVRP